LKLSIQFNASTYFTGITCQHSVFCSFSSAITLWCSQLMWDFSTFPCTLILVHSIPLSRRCSTRNCEYINLSHFPHRVIHYFSVCKCVLHIQRLWQRGWGESFHIYINNAPYFFLLHIRVCINCWLDWNGADIWNTD